MSKSNFATNAEIINASKVLLPKDCCFLDDKEKEEVIKCNESRDIEACPGSGKTTTLLAKLLILANRMPLEGNKGICVLTHTNVAIDEIKEKLGSKADVLFRYPNHFGTIQSFVDKYLTNTYFVNKYGYKLSSIDNDRYRIQFDKSQYKYLGTKAVAFCRRMHSKGYPYSISCSDLIITQNCCEALGLDLTIKDQKAAYEGLLRTKKYSIESGYLNYRDAYDLASYFLGTNKIEENLIAAFANRFQYVFIDEMQDTAKHQIDILDKVFDSEKTTVQRFGDPHQAIYNKVSLVKIWEPRNPLYINSSRRFGESIAKVLRTVCIEDNSDLTASKEIASLPPVMIVFEDPKYVLPKYCELILEKETEYEGEKLSIFEIAKREGKPIKAIGWVGNELDKSKPDRFKLNSYFEGYHKEAKKKEKVDYQSLKSFLRKVENVKAKDYSDKIIEAMLQILRLDGVTYEKNSRKYFYTKTSFLNELNENQLQEKFQKKCSKWIRKIHTSESLNDEIIEKVRKFFTKRLFPVFKVNENNPEVKSFLNAELDENVFSEEIIEAGNCYTYDGKEDLKIEVSNIHQVKGETHTATLYLETSYKANRSCEGFETERILEQLKETPYTNKNLNVQKLNKETLKMAYVGMSRPRYLLCMAVHKVRYDEELDKDNGGLWEIVKTF
ncbi:UvrD-helicase domain-containing protein [Marinifilum flexuosum]|uniref:UvrD-helicase domain-containing protein n=1 Tax=Marinifilum flexuosum TaxID=1117708 RepID=UPI002493C490|nr:UvrD-helicase domain-containing protein [Marinifilum flexuosum]